MTTVAATDRATSALYEQFEERILERDQVGASQVYYDLVRQGRPVEELIRETVRIHAPYTHVPYHQRVDNGVVRFVNNDHCLLSSRTSLRLRSLIGPEYQYLPMAQTVWYVPTGLDPWNQLVGKMPGHYNRRGFDQAPPPPQVHWDDQQPVYLDGTIDERLDQWLTLVQRGEVVPAYQVFLGLLDEEAHREQVLAQLAFAGLIDVQDRILFNRSFTTGHKSYRARATVELGDAIGWENARPIVYAGVPDIAVGPRWYSAYEMAGEVAWIQLAEEDERQRSSLSPTPELPPERRLLSNELPLTSAESAMLLSALLHGDEPANLDAITALLLAGKSSRAIVDVLQVAAAKTVLATSDSKGFAGSQHVYEYTNTVGWFFDRFDHQHRIKLLYVAASFIRQVSHSLRATGQGEADTKPTREMDEMSDRQLLAHLDEAMIDRRPAESVATVRAYLKAGYDRAPLVRTLAMGAVKHGNDPHNQEIGLCFLEDYAKSSAADRDTLLMGCAQHTAGHIKYGDSLEPYRRFAEAFDLSAERGREGDADPKEQLLD